MVGLVACEGQEWEGLGDEVAEGVARVGAGAIGLIHFGESGAGGIRFPGNFFHVANEFFAFRIDEEAGFAGGIA